jgi:hypothetical protein
MIAHVGVFRRNWNGAFIETLRNDEGRNSQYEKRAAIEEGYKTFSAKRIEKVRQCTRTLWMLGLACPLLTLGKFNSCSECLNVGTTGCIVLKLDGADVAANSVGNHPERTMTTRTHAAEYRVDPTPEAPSEEAFELARNLLRALALEEAYEVHRKDVADALRLTALQLSRPLFRLHGCASCGSCLS